MTVARVVGMRFMKLVLVLVACTPGSTAAPVSTPAATQAAPPSQLATLAAGAGFTCAVTAHNVPKCWGRNNKGQLGTGSTAETILKPTIVGDLVDTVSITAGGQHACALTMRGSVFCWGLDETAPSERNAVRGRPTELLPAGAHVAAIQSGGRHDCMLVSGGVHCMGWGSDGQLGNGSDQPSPTPVDVVGLASNVRSISTGELHSCALRNNGTVSCWGSGRFGRLGNGATQPFFFKTQPVDVVGLENATAIAAGGDRTCAIVERGHVKCWGRVSPGRPLSETQPNELAATPMEVAGVEGAHTISVGKAHTCVSLENGRVECWGWNELGQLGDGTLVDRAYPVVVVGLSNVVAVAASELHTCAALGNGELRCWGDNKFGQLGDGTTKNSPTPVVVVDFP